jgi:hypothetical protein
MSVLQAEQLGLSGADSDEEATQSASQRGMNVSTNSCRCFCQLGRTSRYFVERLENEVADELQFVGLDGFCSLDRFIELHMASFVVHVIFLKNVQYFIFSSSLSP